MPPARRLLRASATHPPHKPRRRRRRGRIRRPCWDRSEGCLRWRWPSARRTRCWCAPTSTPTSTGSASRSPTASSSGMTTLLGSGRGVSEVTSIRWSLLRFTRFWPCSTWIPHGLWLWLHVFYKQSLHLLGISTYINFRNSFSIIMLPSGPYFRSWLTGSCSSVSRVLSQTAWRQF